jgi:hypothetical protein
MYACGCIGGGTHGSIKSYKYSVKKEILQKAVESVIANSNNIRRDSVIYHIVTVDGDKKDTLWDNHFNDTNNYVTIFVKSGNALYKYTFHYYGGKEYWDTAMTSAISIAYAYNANNEGGSEGGRIKEHGSQFIHELVKPFEKEFVDKIDEKLKMEHTEED